MDGIDNAVFRIPGFAAGKAEDFDVASVSAGSVAGDLDTASTSSVMSDFARPVGEVAQRATSVAGAAVRVEAIGAERMAAGTIAMSKAIRRVDNFYDELTAISEEILECRSKILEAC